MCGRSPYGNSVGLCVETPSEGTSVADCSAPYKRRAQGFTPSGFLLFCWCPSVSLLRTGVFGVSSPTLSTDLLMPLRTRQPPGSESLRGPPSLLSSGGHSALSPSCSLRPCLSPQCCAHPGRWGPEARPGSRQTPQHKQACARRHADLDLVPCVGVLTGVGAGPFQQSPGSIPPPAASLSTPLVALTQSPKSL